MQKAYVRIHHQLQQAALYATGITAEVTIMLKPVYLSCKLN